MESRTQGSRPRPRTQKKSEAKAKDSLSEDRHSRGQEQECSRPRPRTKDTKRKCSPKRKKKKVFTKIFQAISKKKRFCDFVKTFFFFFFLGDRLKRPRTSKSVLEDSTSAIYANSLIGFALPISMPRFKSIIICIKISLKLNYFCKKMKKILSPGGSAPIAPKQPPIANFWLRAGINTMVISSKVKFK